MPYYSDMIKATEWHVYVIAEYEHDGSETGYFKIGNARNSKYRLSGMLAGNPRKLKIVWEKNVGSRNAALAVEKLAHMICPNRVAKCEWFKSSLSDVLDAIQTAEEIVSRKIRHNGQYVERVKL